MGELVGVEPAEPIQAYHDTWRDRLVQWEAAQTVRILAQRLGGSPSPAQVAQAAALRLELASRVLAAGALLFPVARIPRIELVAIAVDLLMLIPIGYLAAVIARNDGLRKRGQTSADFAR